jgi:hypothetical protein
VCGTSVHSSCLAFSSPQVLMGLAQGVTALLLEAMASLPKTLVDSQRQGAVRACFTCVACVACVWMCERVRVVIPDGEKMETARRRLSCCHGNIRNVADGQDGGICFATTITDKDSGRSPPSTAYV